MYSVDVQITAFFIFKRLIVDTLQGGSDCQMKSGKELCTVYRRLQTTEDFVTEGNSTVNWSTVCKRHCCEFHIMPTLVTMLNITRIFEITINKIPYT